MPSEMSSLQRVSNYYLYPTIEPFLVSLSTRPLRALRAEFGFQEHPKLRSDYYSAFDGLDLTQTCFGLEYVRPLLPTQRLVGPLLPLELRPLPEPLLAWIESSDADIVYFSLGTIATASEEIASKLVGLDLMFSLLRMRVQLVNEP